MAVLVDSPHPHGALRRRRSAARMRAFVEASRVTDDTRVLDVGGDGWDWDLVDVRPHLTILDVVPPHAPERPKVTHVLGDGCALPFADLAFDVVCFNSVSNGVIAHLGTRARQEAFAREVRRVGRACYAQTPNGRVPLDPHLLTPFVRYLPRRWQRAVYPYTLWGPPFRPTPAEMDANYEQIRRLDRREFASPFPDAAVLTERAAALAKSFAAWCTTPRVAGAAP